jgi:2-methylisocitrate lyase-like PEP mutase family enzyme
MQRIARETAVPQIANMVFGGLTPPLRQTELAALGFGGVLYANAALQAALKAVSEVMRGLRRDGSLDAVADLLAGFEERQRTVGKAHYDELESRYRSAARDPI